MYKLFIHAGSGNHGCEAIVRTTINILNKTTILYSRNPKFDKKYGIDNICKLEYDEQRKINKKSLIWIISALQTKIFGKIDFAIKSQYKNLIHSATSDDIYISIGGDNYCYSGTEILAAINRNIKKRGSKLVLWGCSVEPSLLKQKNIVKDMKNFDLIAARESISYEALKQVNKNTIKISDPAFTLKAEMLSLPNNWIEGNMVGINASPLILQSGKNSSVVYCAYRMLIEYILTNTSFGIALIPHVICDGNDDLTVLFQLYEEYKKSRRIVLIQDHNCMELKGYISRCRFFVGARTHATIAAYSSCVPTLVLGYSVKSRGIAKDLFGTDKNYVLPVQTLCSPDELTNHFKWLVENEKMIKTRLINTIPDYVSKAYIGKKYIEKLIKGDKSATK